MNYGVSQGRMGLCLIEQWGALSGGGNRGVRAVFGFWDSALPQGDTPRPTPSSPSPTPSSQGRTHVCLSFPPGRLDPRPEGPSVSGELASSWSSPRVTTNRPQTSSPGGQLGGQSPHDHPPPGQVALVLPGCTPPSQLSPEAPPTSALTGVLALRTPEHLNSAP